MASVATWWLVLAAVGRAEAAPTRLLVRPDAGPRFVDARCRTTGRPGPPDPPNAPDWTAVREALGDRQLPAPLEAVLARLVRENRVERREFDALQRWLRSPRHLAGPDGAVAQVLVDGFRLPARLGGYFPGDPRGTDAPAPLVAWVVGLREANSAEILCRSDRVQQLDAPRLAAFADAIPPSMPHLWLPVASRYLQLGDERAALEAWTRAKASFETPKFRAACDLPAGAPESEVVARTESTTTLVITDAGQCRWDRYEAVGLAAALPEPDGAVSDSWTWERLAWVQVAEACRNQPRAEPGSAETLSEARWDGEAWIWYTATWDGSSLVMTASPGLEPPPCVMVGLTGLPPPPGGPGSTVGLL